ncbi:MULTISPECIES: hypothetical protein [unclassified Streptomyces]
MSRTACRTGQRVPPVQGRV